MDVKQLEGMQLEQLQFLQIEYDILQGKCTAKNEQVDSLREKVGELELKIEKLKKELADKTTEHTLEKQKNKELSSDLTKAKKELEKEQTRFQKEKDILQFKITQAEEKLENELMRLEEERGDLLAIQSELEEEQKEFRRLKKDFSLSDAINMQGELARLRSNYEEIVSHSRTIQEEKLKLQSRIENAEKLEFENATLKQELARRDELVKVYRQAEVEMQRLEQIKSDYSAILERSQHIESMNHKLNAELAKAREEAATYREQAERVQTAEHRSAFYEVRVRNLERELVRLQKKEHEAIADESRVFESFQVLIETHEKTSPKSESYPGDVVAVNRIIQAAEQGNYEFLSEMIYGFIAAMRSTRFIILKGLSGTGKTSLPKIVAHALGGICETIAVQPNWKSKTDLIGFYNHFNDRFMATQFTEELFKAQLPENRDKFYFIVLDEMNLARVEYYFSDFNSKLELEQSKQIVELFDTIGRTSGDLSDYIIDGNKLRIPPNVYFIGTINEDESTYTLSDKIYDRAQVLDFQAALSNKVGNMEKIESMPSVSFSQFKQQDEQIQTTDVARMMRPIDDILKVLSDKLYLEIGNRPRRHMRTFLQTYVANNWNINDAIDLQIVSKIVPKIMPSYDEEFEVAMDLIISLAVQNKAKIDSVTVRAIEKVKRNAK